MGVKVVKESKKIYISGVIDKESALNFKTAVDELSEGSKDLKEPTTITLIIDSNGGCVVSGFGIIDTIIEANESKDVKINTHVSGMAYSMGFYIWIVGNKRTMGKHSYIMNHGGYSVLYGNLPDIEVDIRHIKDMEKKCLNLITKFTKISLKEAKETIRLKRDDYYDHDQGLAILKEVKDYHD